MSEKCSIPVSATFTVENSIVTAQEFVMSEFDASVIADLLIGEFGIDIEASITGGESDAAA